MIVPEIMRVGFKYIAKTNSGYTAIIILRLIPSPLVIRQGGIASEEQAFPIAFSMPFTALGTVDISAGDSSYNNYDDEFTLTKTSIKFRYFPHHFVAFGI